MICPFTQNKTEKKEEKKTDGMHRCIIFQFLECSEFMCLCRHTMFLILLGVTE